MSYRRGGSEPARVIVTETGVDIRDVTINTRGSDTHPGTNSKFTNVILYAPDGEVHIAATRWRQTSRSSPRPSSSNPFKWPLMSRCPAAASRRPPRTTARSPFRTYPTGQGRRLLLEDDCDPTGCPGAGCFEAPASGNATTVVLDTAAIPAGTYHVIARFVGSGSYCSEGTITLP